MPSKVAKPRIPKKTGSPSPKAVKPTLTAHLGSLRGDAPVPIIAKKGRGRPVGGGYKKKKKDHQYRSHMGVVLRQVHPDMKISSTSVATMNSFLNDIFERIVDEAAKYVIHKKLIFCQITMNK